MKIHPFQENFEFVRIEVHDNKQRAFDDSQKLTFAAHFDNMTQTRCDDCCGSVAFTNSCSDMKMVEEIYTMYPYRWTQQVICAVSLFCFAWFATPAQANPNFASTASTYSQNKLLQQLKQQPNLSSAYEKMSRKYLLRSEIKETTTLGVMSQGLSFGDPWFFSSYLSGPFMAGGIVLLIGHASILTGDDYDSHIYMAWGVTGLIWGILGTGAAVLSMILDIGNSGNANPNPTGGLLAFNIINIAIQLTVAGMGIGAIVRASNKSEPARVSWAPWFNQDRNGNVQMGMMFNGTF